jgi:6-phosphogluconolactonase
MKNRFLLHLCIFALLAWIRLSNAAPGDYLLYVGTYTGAKSKGIYTLRMDSNGKLTAPTLAAEIASPSFLAVHPNRKYLYAANEVADFKGKKDEGAVSSFSIDPSSGKLTLLNQQPSGGSGPCHVAVDKSGRTLLVANYAGGSVASYSIDKDGTLSEPISKIQHQGSSVNKQRQEKPHAHFITADPGNRYVLTCDLGLDQVLLYRLDVKTSELTPNDPPFGKVKPGAGPRHLSFHPSGKFVYVNNEIDSTLTAFTFDKKNGSLAEIQTVSTLPESSARNSTAETEVHPSGKFVYVSNRGHDSIACFSIDQKSGKVTSIEHESTQGKTPRNFAIDPKGKFLLAENQNSDTIVVFAVDQKTGELTPTGHKAEVSSPVCIVFVPTN